MSWVGVDTGTDGVHVLPWDEERDVVAGDHVAVRTCPCHPVPERDAPLDEPVWSHREPGWPGAKVGPS